MIVSTDPRIVILTIESLFRHENGAIPVSQGGHGNTGSHTCGYHSRGRPPLTVAVIGFFRSKGYPTYVIVGTHPGDTTRIPTRFRLGRRRRLPVPATIYIDPVPVVVRRVAEGLIRDPGVITVPFRPAACGKRRPILRDLSRPPHLDFPTLIGYALPPAVFFQLIGVVLQGLGQVLGGLHGLGVTLCPHIVTGLVPG